MEEIIGQSRLQYLIQYLGTIKDVQAMEDRAEKTADEIEQILKVK